ncbi:hypothetical protein F2Q69_00042243 [Brassica cretica]|uniref:Uncharacterized protein n=1 Tax=Brassica cretica TaxID=69181 RepID=A0A8S9NKC1_BRACR|nr:hypothetical protein F2Q69_00042243 [Brassica cretica]
MSPAVLRRNKIRIPRRSDQTESSETKNPLKDQLGTLEIETGADTRTGLSRRDGSVNVAKHLSPLHLKAEADQCTEADGPTGKWPQKMKAPTLSGTLVNELLKKGHLREFLFEKAESHLNKETTGKPTEAASVSPPRQDRVIHVISAHSEISGMSHAAAKESTWNAKHGLDAAKPKGLLLGRIQGSGAEGNRSNSEDNPAYRVQRRNVLSRTGAHVKWEEDVASCAKAQQNQDPKTIRPDRIERDEKPSQRPARDYGNRNRGRYQNWPIQKGWQQVASEDESTDSFRNPGYRCDFHRDHGHKTEDCVALNIKVNELLKKGHLREFLSEKVECHLNKETTEKPTEAASVSPPRQDRVIHVISARSEISGMSHAAAKEITWNAKHGLDAAKPKGLLLGTDDISFTAKE